MIVVNKAKAAWSEQRTCWRIDVQYQNADGASKRTYISIPDCEPHKTRGASKAEQEAKSFRKGVGGLFSTFLAKNDASRPAPKVAALPSPMKTRKTAPTISWLLHACLKHPEVWGSVAHSKNYISGVKKLDTMIGDRLVSEFEPPHGRKLVVDLITGLRDSGNSDGYIRKIAYQLRQALRAAVGEGVTEIIGHPETGEQLISDIPNFPSLPKSPGRTAVLERDHDQIVFKIIRDRRARAKEEERAWGIKNGTQHLLGVGAQGRVEIGGEVVWLNSRRFSSIDWMTFESYIMFLLETGCRRSEALSVGNHSIRWREVTEADGTVSERFPVLFLPAEVTKTGQDRFINLTPNIVSAMKLWQAFAKPHSFKIGDRTIARTQAWFPLAPTKVSNMWEHIRTDAKTIHAVDLSNVSPHNLRHTHATRMSERGMSGKPLSDSLGHTDERTTRIYDHSQSVDQSRRYFARNVSG
jgi:hypothetical protein